MIEIYRGRDVSRGARRKGAIKIANGFYLSEEPTPLQLAQIMSREWPDLALDGYSAARRYLEQPLQFPLEFIRDSTLPSSTYFRSRRARPKALGSMNGVNVCSPLQCIEAMAQEDAVAFIEAFFAGPHGRSRIETEQLDFRRLPKHTREVLEKAIVGADSKPERDLTRGLEPHAKVRNNVRIGPYRWDLVLEEHKVAIEVDGYAYHKGENRQRFEIDRQKLNDAVQRGYRPLHFTAATIEHHLDVAVHQVLAVIKGRGEFVAPPWKWHHYWRWEGERCG